MSEPIDVSAIEPGQEVTVDHFQPEDAPGVAAAFEAVYGQGYPVKTYYHPEELIVAAEASEINPAVGRTPRGEVVGAVSLYRSAPYERIYEAGAGLVIPAYRRRGINTKLNAFLYGHVTTRVNAVMVYGESVCNHIYQQKAQAGEGLVPTALEVDLMPAAAYDREKSASGRVAALIDYRSYQPRKHKVHLPVQYQDQLSAIYQWTSLDRTFEQADVVSPGMDATRMSTRVFDFAAVARLTVWQLGEDFGQSMDQQLAESQAAEIKVIQVWLNLADEAVAHGVAALQERDFFFGGLLPHWFDSDGLLMQKLEDPPNWEGIALHLDQAKTLLGFAREDWSNTQS